MNLRRQDFVSKTDLTGLLTEAKNCMNRTDYPGAIAMLQRVCKLNPSDYKVLTDLGMAHLSNYDFAAAEKCFAEVIRMAPSKSDALLSVGTCWTSVRNYDAAKACFEQALQLPQIPVVAFFKLVEIYLRLQKFDEAIKITDRGLKMHGVHEGLLLCRGRIHRQMKQLKEAENLFRWMLSKPDAVPEARVTAWYELANILDQQGQYDEAMKACLEAKTLMRQTSGTQVKVMRMKQGRLREMSAAADEKLVQKWRKSGATDLQPSRNMALLCGYARSGTTLLEYVLDSHPQIVTVEETAIYHNVAYYPLGCSISPNTPFVTAVDWMSPRIARQIRSEYFRGVESYLGEPIGDRLLMDKNPANTFDIPSIARIFPENKFVVALRDPRDVCLSCFMQPVVVTPDTASWLSLDWTMEHYALIMGLWQAWKPAIGNGAIEVRYEDLVNNMETATRPVLEFLGLPWDEKVLRFNETARNSIVRSPTYAEVTKPLYKTAVARWKNYEKYFAPHLEKLTPMLKAFGYE